MSAKRQQGMTLLEVMVALSIFSVIGLASYQVLSSVMAANQAVKSSAGSLERIQKSYAQIERDMEQLVARSVRSSVESISEPLVISEQSQQIEFTRGGRANPLQLSRSDLLRVRYDIGLSTDDSADKQIYLRRLSWAVLDRSIEDKPLVQLLLPVDSLTLSAITNKGRYEQWPLEELADGEYLQALSVAVNHRELGELIRLVKVY